MTRPEAEAVVRGITRTCRGVPKLSAEKRSALHAAFYLARQSNDVLVTLRVVRNAEAAAEIWQPLLGNDLDRDWMSLAHRASTAIFAFSENCGADVNDVICAQPFDGKEHERVCPKCGATDTYQAPFFELS